jgi:maleate isomerase
MKDLALIIPHTDITLEKDLRAFLPPQTVLHTQRIWLEAVSEAAEKHMVDVDLPQGIRYLKDITTFDGAVFGCTSASAVYGSEGLHRLETLLRDAFKCPGISALGAVLGKMKTHKASAIALFTPYTDEVNHMMVRNLEAFGLTTTLCRGMGLVKDTEIAAVKPEAITRFILESSSLLARDIDAIFISCTNFRAMEVKETISSITGLPTITSNSAIIDWIKAL